MHLNKYYALDMVFSSFAVWLTKV